MSTGLANPSGAGPFGLLLPRFETDESPTGFSLSGAKTGESPAGFPLSGVTFP